MLSTCTFVTSLSRRADDTKNAPDKQSLMHWSLVATRTDFDPAATKRAACAASTELLLRREEHMLSQQQETRLLPRFAMVVMGLSPLNAK